MVYIWPEKVYLLIPAPEKSWHLVGFEPTLFGRAKVQPHYAYQPIAKTYMVYIWPERCVFSYILHLNLKMLAPGGIWTHTVRAREGATTLRVSAHSKNAYGLYLAGKRCICLYLHLKKLAPGGIWTRTVRAGECATTLRILNHLPSTPSLVASLLAVAAEWREMLD